MRRFWLTVLTALGMSGLAYAYKTVVNPFTGKPDFVGASAVDIQAAVTATDSSITVTKTATGVSLASVGGGGASTLAVGTGTASNFTNNITSPTAAISLLGTQFNSSANGTTNFISLTNTGVSAGTYGSATQVSSVTVGADGRVTSASNVTISLTNSNLQSGTYSNVTVPAANVAAGSLGGSVLTSSFPVSGVTAGSYTNTNLTVNAQGIVTAASNGTGGGGAPQDFDLKDSTGAFNRQIDHSTNSVVNVSSIGWSGTYDSGNNQWVTRPSTFSMVNMGSSGQTLTGATAVTVNGLAFWAPASSTITGHFELYMNNSSSNSGGYKFSMIGPSGVAYFEMTGGGSGSASTSTRLDQQASALNTLTGAFIGTYTSNAASFHFGFQLITGTTAGYVNVQVTGATGSGNNFINSESQIWATLK